MFEQALPVLLAFAVLEAGLLLASWRLRRPDHYGPPLARGFLRGGRFRRPWSREAARGHLFRLASQANAAGDESAAKLLERAAFALGEGADAQRTLVAITGPLPEVWTAGAEDLREVDRLELQRRDRPDRQSGRRPGESPVFRDGEFVGWLRGRGIDKDPEGTVLAWNGGVQMIRRKTWETSANDDELASLPPNVFRLAIVALALAFAGLLSPVAAHAAGRTYHPEALAWVAAEPPGSAEVPTHIRIEGEVAYVAHEADGDVHVRLCHNRRCMVAECVPGKEIDNGVRFTPNPRGGPIGAMGRSGPRACLALRVGQRVAVWGISRYDGAPGHREQAEGAENRRGHWEVHPVEGIEVLP